MTSGEACQTGIGPTSPSSLNTSSDLNEETIPSVKNAWTEIVRGASHAARPKVASPTKDYQQEMHHNTSCEHTRVTGMIHPVLPAGPTTSSSGMSAVAKLQELDAGITEKPCTVSLDSTAGFVDVPPISSSNDLGSLQIDKRQVPIDIVSETGVASPDGSAKHVHPCPVKSPKPAWGKPAAKAGENLEPEPVMGAMAWPALAEARNMKSSEPTKSATQKLSGKQSTPSVSDEQYLKESPLLREEVGANRGVLPSPKAFNQHQIAGNGNISTDSTSLNTVKITHFEDSGHSRQPGSREVKIAAGVDHGAVTQRNLSPVSTTPGNNYLRDQGRSNQGWPTHGRGYANSRDSAVPPQRQWATHRNLQQPFVPFFNPNPGFVHATGFHNVPGNMYYMPAPRPEPLLGATYFVPPMQGVVQGMMVPGPDPMALQRMLVNQIEYYFSVENLCRDIYLRSNMDEQGFVPISLIVTFNRVRKITQNPLFIVDALQSSCVVEVQGDKVRKRGDWANWLLPSSQKSGGVSTPLMDELSASLRKTEIDQSRSCKMERESNGVGYSTMATQAQEKSETHHRSGLCLDPVTTGFRSSAGDRREEFVVDEKVESKKAAQYTEFQSHNSIK